MLIPFGCLPPENTDEWIILKPFVETYNSLFNRNFVLAACPEKNNRNSPEPEILLCDGNLKMVVERKIIPLPLDYVREHQLWHQFNDRLMNQIIDNFSDNLYEFRIQDIHLPKKKKNAIKLADEIAAIILEYESKIKEENGEFSGGIYCDDLISWKFETISTIDKENYLQDSGIISKLGLSRIHYTDNDKENELLILTEYISQLVNKAILKFKKYNNCFRVLIIEPYSCHLKYPVDIIFDAVDSLEVNNCLDQIWIARRYEINDYETIVNYELLRNNLA